jgi:hypothetical protein
LDISEDPISNLNLTSKVFTDHTISEKSQTQFLDDLMKKVIPQTDFLLNESMRVSEYTMHLWQTVADHIKFFYDVINGHDFRDGVI